MDTSHYAQTTKRLIKHRLRVAIANHSQIEGMAEEMVPFEEGLRAEWEGAVKQLGALGTREWDTLSALAHDLYLEVTREMRSNNTMVLAGLADFATSFRVEDVLPPRVAVQA